MRLVYSLVFITSFFACKKEDEVRLSFFKFQSEKKISIIEDNTSYGIIEIDSVRFKYKFGYNLGNLSSKPKNFVYVQMDDSTILNEMVQDESIYYHSDKFIDYDKFVKNNVLYLTNKKIVSQRFDDEGYTGVYIDSITTVNDRKVSFLMYGHTTDKFKSMEIAWDLKSVTIDNQKLTELLSNP